MNHVKLSDVCVKITDGSHNPPKGQSTGEYFMLSSRNIQESGITFDTARLLTHEDFVQENKRTDVMPGDVLLTIVGTIGRTVVVPQDLPKFTLQRSVAVLKPNTDLIDSRFLMFTLRTKLKFLESNARGAAQKGIYLNQLKNIDIDLPSLEEQRRIVETLEKAFEKTDRAIELTSTSQHHLESLITSLMREYFSSNTTRVTSIPLSEITEQILAGGDVPKGSWSKVKNAQHSIPIFTNGEKNDGLYGFTNVARIHQPSVTISARGTIGYTSIRREPYYPAVRLISAIPDQSKIDLKYLFYALKSITFLNTGSSIPQLTVPMIKNYKVPMMELTEQKRIAAKLDQVYESKNRIARLYAQKSQRLLDLKQSLLEDAFSESAVK